ncbi:MAG: DUF2231 domain-containing protein [Polyangiaceae bacterium]|nr:DUF2231 domain-containing protein [Polyangiaceae bacterium]
MPDVYHVMPGKGGRWSARHEGNGEIESFGSRAEAVRRAREEAEFHTPSEVVVHRADGSVEESIAWAEGTAAELPAAPSRATIAGHPIHPMLIPFPVALLTLLPISDMAYWATNDPFFARSSFVLAVAGLVATGLAAIVGLIDFTLVRRVRETRAGWVHLASNLGIAGLTVANVVLRAPDRSADVVPTGTLLSIVTLGLLLVSGWYGGELAYRHRVGVTATGPAERHRSRTQRSRSTR